jgi:fibronectin-binding autotransporter adhesin
MATTIMAAVCAWSLAPQRVHAAVTASGDVSPAPPAGGGNVAATFRVGNTGVGTLAIDGSTPLNVTGGNAIFGDTSTGMGLVELTGFNSNLSAALDLIIGNAGLGKVKVLEFSKITTGDDLLMGTNATALGELLVEGLGSFTVVGDTIYVGTAGVAHIDVVHGGRIDADDSILGQVAGGRGRVTVTGTGSRLIQTNSIVVGDSGRGELNVLDQGLVTATNALVGGSATGVGVATVSGPDSQWKITGLLHHGWNGVASLNIGDGGTVTTTGVMRMAMAAGSASYALVSDANSLLSVGTTLTIGESGYGSLEVLNGGRVKSLSATMGDNADSRGAVIVDGVNSLWEITGSLDVSQPGEAELVVSREGRVKATGALTIGSAGRVTLDDGRLEIGSTGVTNNGVIRGGGRLAGNLLNGPGGTMHIGPGDALILNNGAINNGLIDLDDGELETLAPVVNNADIDARFGATLRFGAAGLDNNSGSQLAITGGAVDVFGGVDNNLGAEIAVVGGASAVFHNAVTNNGVIFVSASSKIALLDNLSFVPASSLGVQLASLVAEAEPTDAFGLVDVSGASTLAGNLTVTLAAGFAPAVGDTFEILRASGGLSGSFATESLPALSAGLALDVQYTPNSVVLAVVSAPSLSADFDEDGDVDAADLAKWKIGFGIASGAAHAQGDADGNGAVDGSDFHAWQRQFGTTLAAPTAGAIPEPTSALLLSLVAAGGFLARRR